MMDERVKLLTAIDLSRFSGKLATAGWSGTEERLQILLERRGLVTGLWDQVQMLRSPLGWIAVGVKGQGWDSVVVWRLFVASLLSDTKNEI